MKKNIVVLDGYTANPGDLSWAKIQALGKFTIYDRTDSENVYDRIKDAEIVFTNKVLLPNDLLDKCPKLEWIGVLATGYNVIDVSYARTKGIPVTNIPAYSTASVTQHVFALLLNTTNFVAPYSSMIRQGAWAKSKDFTMSNFTLGELASKTIGLVGFGTIGKEVAKVANAFGMKVLVYTANPKKNLETDNLKFTDLNTLLAESDVVSLHCLLSDQTKGIINKENLSKMKKSAILINTARGPLVIEEDLAHALNMEIIQGACLDVLISEPPKEDNPLFVAKNCIITPHVAWNSFEARSRLMEIASENIRSYLEDGILKNCVN